MMFSLLLKLQIVTLFVPGCTGRLPEMGLIAVTIKLLSLVLQQPIFIGWDKMLHLTYCYVSKIIF